MPKLEDPMEAIDLVRNYLRPKNGNPAPRAHLFTVNGFTYPFVRDLGFACVPDPPETNDRGYSTQKSKRRFSILSYLFSVREGDLLFFFQADPQHKYYNVRDRRGFRGIFMVTSSPFRDRTKIVHPQTKYEIHGECPNCGTPFAMLGLNCEICGKKYPEVDVYHEGRSHKHRIHVLSARLLIKPLIVFERTLGDNRAYADMSDPGLIWISRADNAMGRGKGSSIRTLLPEEAVKLTRLLVTEPDQRIIEIENPKYPSNTRDQIKNEDDTPCTHPRLRDDGETLKHELYLNLHIARTIDDPSSSIRKELGDIINQNDLEYWTSELPWGYTGETADFVATLHDPERGRYRIIIFEFKKDRVDDRGLLQVIVYVAWVAQVCTQFADPPVSDVEVIPVLVGKNFNLSFLPKEYSFEVKYLVGPKKKIRVKTPRLIEYEPDNVYTHNDVYYAEDIIYSDVTDKVKGRVKWHPPTGVTSGNKELDWLLETWINVGQGGLDK